MPDPTLSKREQNKQFNRNAILQSAKLEFAAHGFNGANLTQIIEHSGLATGTFYKYFDNKETLYAAVSSQLAEEVSEILRNCYKATQLPEPYIQLVLQEVAMFVIKDPSNLDFVLRNNSIIAESLGGKGPWAQITVQLREYLEFAVNQQMLPKQDTGLMIQALLGSASAVLSYIANDCKSLIEKQQALEFLGRFISNAILTKRT
ncbi:MAG: TetR/AcrR family transcriptional regulator [Gammaproteobacteria bacterium]|nr:TetR/AcrR family transcriptional regulator [Gammaproteobacteria bacterium]